MGPIVNRRGEKEKMQNRKKEEKMNYKTRQLDSVSEKRNGKQKPIR